MISPLKCIKYASSLRFFWAANLLRIGRIPVHLQGKEALRKLPAIYLPTEGGDRFMSGKMH